MPDAFRPWLSDVAERAQCPPEYPAIGALVAFSAVIGRACVVRPKRHDDWTVVPNLYLRAAGRGGRYDDGLIQRFQLVVYPDPPTTWRNVDRWPDSDARRQAFDLFKRADAITAESLAAQLPDLGDGLPFLRFDGRAQGFFDEWREALMTRLRACGEHPAIDAHLSKFPSLLPSLALLFHLADAHQLPPGPVAEMSARRAAAWCDFLEAHARRLYGAVAAETLIAAHALLRRIRAGAVGSTFTSRDVYRACWTGLSDREVVEDALSLLEDYGWVRRAAVETAGRPRTEYTVHPSLRASTARDAAE